MNTILVTGSAGFIGFHASLTLLKKGVHVIGVDNLNNYYDPSLKTARNKILKENKNYKFYKINICDYKKIEQIFKKNKINKICHLAAEVGVRSSIDRPIDYVQTNIVGFTNIIDLARKYKIEKFVFASSSSVYGNNKKLPFSEIDNVDQPISIYAATKKSDELIAYAYHHLYKLPCVGLRFFTVYGPWGRPDMALFKFIKLILQNKSIPIYNKGNHQRDFTYIDDIIAGVQAALDEKIDFNIINLGNNTKIKLAVFIKKIEAAIGKKAKIKYLLKQNGDVLKTRADISRARKILNYKPKVGLEEGLQKFIKWYRQFYY